MTETIMFVDDEENILHALRRVFRKESYEVITCLSAEKALEVLAKKEYTHSGTTYFPNGNRNLAALKDVVLLSGGSRTISFLA